MVTQHQILSAIFSFVFLHIFGKWCTQCGTLVYTRLHLYHKMNLSFTFVYLSFASLSYLKTVVPWPRLRNRRPYSRVQSETPPTRGCLCLCSTTYVLSA